MIEPRNLLPPGSLTTPPRPREPDPYQNRPTSGSCGRVQRPIGYELAARRSLRPEAAEADPAHIMVMPGFDTNCLQPFGDKDGRPEQGGMTSRPPRAPIARGDRADLVCSAPSRLTPAATPKDFTHEGSFDEDELTARAQEGRRLARVRAERFLSFSPPYYALLPPVAVDGAGDLALAHRRPGPAPVQSDAIASKFAHPKQGDVLTCPRRRPRDLGYRQTI